MMFSVYEIVSWLEGVMNTVENVFQKLHKRINNVDAFVTAVSPACSAQTRSPRTVTYQNTLRWLCCLSVSSGYRRESPEELTRVRPVIPF